MNILTPNSFPNKNQNKHFASFEIINNKTIVDVTMDELIVWPCPRTKSIRIPINQEQIQQYIETGKIIIQINSKTKEIILKPEEIEKLKLLFKNETQKLHTSNKETDTEENPKPEIIDDLESISKNPKSETTPDNPKPEIIDNTPKQITEETQPEINNPTPKSTDDIPEQITEEIKPIKPISNIPTQTKSKRPSKDLITNKEKISKMYRSFNTQKQIEINFFEIENETGYIRIQNQPFTLGDFIAFIFDLNEYLQNTTVPIESTKYSIKNNKITFANKKELPANKQELISALEFYIKYEDQFKSLVSEEKIESIVDYWYFGY